MKDDATLVSESLGGNAEAFGELVKRYESMVRGLAHRIGTGGEEDDVTQSVLATAYEKLRSLEDPRKFDSWLWGITARISWRWSAQRRAGALSATLEEELRTAEAEHPLSEAERHELRDRIGDAIAALPEVQQVPIVYRFLDGLSYAEIAHILDLSTGQVRGRIFRGTQTLRARLRDLWEELYASPAPVALPAEIEHILRHHPGSVMVISDDFEIMAVNDPYSKRTGYHASSVLGHRCYEISHGRTEPCDGREHPCPIKMLTDSRKQVRVQHLHQNKDGTGETVDVTLFAVDEKTPDGPRRYYVELLSSPADAPSD